MQLLYAGDGDSSTPNSPVGLTQEEARQGREPSRAQSHSTFTLGSRTLGCLITTAHGYQLSEGTAQQRAMKANGPRAEGSYWARWPSLGPGKPCGHTHLSNGLCVARHHEEARDQFNRSPSRSDERNLQPTWGVRSPCPKARRQ